MPDNPAKPFKEKDLVARTRLLGISAWVFPFLALVGLIGGYLYYGKTGAVAGVLLALGISVLVGFLTMSTTQTIGGSAVDILFGRRRGLWSLREQLEGPLRQARTQFEAELFDEALNVINKVIAKDPRFPEALLLKGRILWEGFHNDGLAKLYLLRTMALAPDEADPIHLQAAGLINDIKIYDGPTTHLPLTEGREQVDALRREASNQGIAAAIGRKTSLQIARTGSHRFLVYGVILWSLLVAGLLWRADTRLADLGHRVESVGQTATRLHQKLEDQNAAAARFLNTLAEVQKQTE